MWLQTAVEKYGPETLKLTGGRENVLSVKSNVLLETILLFFLTDIKRHKKRDIKIFQKEP